MKQTTRVFPGRVIFDHLPKTAGQAVNAWLRESLGDGCVTDNLIGRQRELIAEYGGSYSIISGHVIFDGKGLDPRYEYVICFRHPVDRIISWIYFVLTNHKEQDIVELRKCVSLFVESRGEQGGGCLPNNDMTLHLCAVDGFVSSEPQKLVEHAIEILDQYALWGLYERLPEFISDFAAWLGIPAPKKLNVVNKTVERPSVDQISASLRLKIEELNQLDLALYERLVGIYGQARKRWQRPSVAVSKWQPMLKAPPRRFSDKDFVLISITQESGSNVDQKACLTFSIEFSLARPVERMECGIHIHDERGALAYGTNTSLIQSPVGQLLAGTHRVTFSLITDLPEGSYDVGFNFIEITSDGGRKDLGWFDQMTSFRVTIDRQPNCVGYLSLPVAIEHYHIDNHVVRKVQDGRGDVMLLRPVIQVIAGEEWHQPVVLLNQSDQLWQGTSLNPVNLSYHWLTENREVVLFDGVRSALPGSLLRPNESVSMDLHVRAPDEPGHYLLQVLPVQENHAWFDALGFSVREWPIEVVGPDASRRYAADDCRLNSQVGELRDGVRISDGREGFLVYGPYTTLSPGRWRVRWTGEFDPRDGRIRADVTCRDGTVVLGQIEIAAPTREIVLELETPEQASRVEFRVWIGTNTFARLGEIMIALI